LAQAGQRIEGFLSVSGTWNLTLHEIIIQENNPDCNHQPEKSLSQSWMVNFLFTDGSKNFTFTTTPNGFGGTYLETNPE